MEDWMLSMKGSLFSRRAGVEANFPILWPCTGRMVTDPRKSEGTERNDPKKCRYRKATSSVRVEGTRHPRTEAQGPQTKRIPLSSFP